jgi:hypothetical protein
MVTLDEYLGKLSRKELEVAVVALALDKGVDLATGGRLNKYTKKALVALGRRLLPIAARPAASLGATAVGISRLALTNPYVVGGALIYVAVTEREKIAQLLQDGAQIIKEEKLLSPSTYIEARQEFIEENPEQFATIPFTDFKVRPSPGRRPIPLGKRKKSGYNKAVSAGMKAIKASTSFGKKGVIKPATKAFKTVISVGKGIKAKRKAPKKGIRRKVYTAMKRFY